MTYITSACTSYTDPPNTNYNHVSQCYVCDGPFDDYNGYHESPWLACIEQSVTAMGLVGDKYESTFRSHLATKIDNLRKYWCLANWNANDPIIFSWMKEYPPLVVCPDVRQSIQPTSTFAELKFLPNSSNVKTLNLSESDIQEAKTQLQKLYNPNNVPCSESISNKATPSAQSNDQLFLLPSYNDCQKQHSYLCIQDPYDIWNGILARGIAMFNLKKDNDIKIYQQSFERKKNDFAAMLCKKQSLPSQTELQEWMTQFPPFVEFPVIEKGQNGYYNTTNGIVALSEERLIQAKAFVADFFNPDSLPCKKSIEVYQYPYEDVTNTSTGKRPTILINYPYYNICLSNHPEQQPDNNNGNDNNNNDNNKTTKSFVIPALIIGSIAIIGIIGLSVYISKKHKQQK